MSLSLALNTALSGLNVNQKSLATLSQNIANANNPEYSRKVLSQEAVYLQGTGAGVSIRDISRKVDEYLQKSVRTQGSVHGRSLVLSDYTERLQNLLGRPGSNNSIYSYATSFFNALQGLSQTPENASLRTSVVSIAENTATAMNSLAEGIYDMQFAVDQDIKRAISNINSNLKDIYALNATISSNKLLGRSVSELEDRRDTKLKEISQYMDMQIFQQSSGVVNIFAAGGFSMLDESVYELSYNGATSAEFFANGNPTNAILLHRLDEQGNRTGTPSTIVSAGVGSAVTSVISSGQLKGFLELRDRQLPDVLAKLDMLASRMRDEINAVHNSGTAFPGANSLTGTRLVGGEDFSEWTGQVRIAVLGADGKPIPSNYSDESSGMRPLLIDLSTLDTGNTDGKPSVQGIIDEINRYYGVPQNKMTLGNVNDIRLVLNNDTIPGTDQELNFDFKLDNISGSDAKFYVTDVQVLDDTDTDITDISQDVPMVDLASTATYTTSLGSSQVIVKTASAHGYTVGDKIYLTAPSSDVDGIEAANLGGFFTIANVSTTGFTITVNGTATSGGPFDRTGVTARNSYYTAETGTNARSKQEGTITSSISSNPTSDYYTVKANVTVIDADGNLSSSVVSYRITNLQANVRNYPYVATAVTGSGTIVTPNNIYPAMTAKLVDANGNELPIINNQYSTTERGYLKLVAGNASYVIAVDSMDSVEVGKTAGDPPVEATGRGFSHYFELNNFFKHNRVSGAVADDDAGSAANLDVSDAISRNVNLLALGGLNQSGAPVDPNAAPLYTYERNFGDNSVIARLADFGTNIIAFGAAGDLGATSLSFSGYAGQMISTTSTRANGNKSEMNNAKLLLDGFTERADGVRGVNLDEELANTIIYQNAYSASARIITVANQFFEALMEAVR